MGVSEIGARLADEATPSRKFAGAAAVFAGVSRKARGIHEIVKAGPAWRESAHLAGAGFTDGCPGQALHACMSLTGEAVRCESVRFAEATSLDRERLQAVCSNAR